MSFIYTPILTSINNVSSKHSQMQHSAWLEQHASRSHCIFFVQKKKNVDQDELMAVMGKFHVCVYGHQQYHSCWIMTGLCCQSQPLFLQRSERFNVRMCLLKIK